MTCWAQRLLVVCLLIIGTQVSNAQNIAFLEDGPGRGRGLPFLEPNATEFRSALYRYGDMAVDVYIVPIGTWPGDGWQLISLGETDDGYIRTKRGYTVVRSDTEFFRIYIVFDEDTDRDRVLRFAEGFFKRLDYFLSRGNTAETVPFPAILEEPGD